MKQPRFLAGLTPNVIRLGWVSFLADVSSEMLYPVIPLFITGVLGAPVSVVGLIEGVAEGLSSLLKGGAGYWSDVMGRRKGFVVVGYWISALAKPMLALATGWPWVLFSRSLDRIGKGLRAGPRDALLADSVSSRHMGKAFGWHRGMDSMGAVLGPLLAIGWIFLFRENLKWIFVASFVPASLGALAVLTVKDLKKVKKTYHKDKKTTGKLSFFSLPVDFRVYLLAWFCFSIGNSSDMFLILRAKELGFTVTRTILLYAFYNGVYAVSSPWLGQLSDVIERRVILTLGLVVFALVYLGLAFSNQAWQVWALFGLYGFYSAATDGVGKALVVDWVAPEIRASALGLLGTVTGVATLLASPIAGILWGFGSKITLLYGALGAVTSVFIISVKLKSPIK